jgi:hypothetical protein
MKHESPWFKRTFGAKPPKRKVTTQEAAALVGRAIALEHAASLARIFEAKGADAGTVRVALEFQASDARAELDRLIVEALDEEPPVCLGKGAAGDSSSNVTELHPGWSVKV